MKKRKVILTSCKRKSGEAIVQNGLAITPARVLQMAEQGVAASAQMNAQMIEGHTGTDWNVPLEERRGIDIATMWQESLTARKKIRDAHAASQVVNSQTE